MGTQRPGAGALRPVVGQRRPGGPRQVLHHRPTDHGRDHPPTAHHRPTDGGLHRVGPTGRRAPWRAQRLPGGVAHRPVGHRRCPARYQHPELPTRHLPHLLHGGEIAMVSGRRMGTDKRQFHREPQVNGPAGRLPGRCRGRGVHPPRAFGHDRHTPGELHPLGPGQRSQGPVHPVPSRATAQLANPDHRRRAEHGQPHRRDGRPRAALCYSRPRMAILRCLFPA